LGIKLLFTGDFCPHQRIEQLAIKENYNAVFNEFAKEFEGNDFNVVDLECPLTSIRTKLKKTGPHQVADPKTINLLKEIKVDLVAMANNHILDYGEKAMLDTVKLCRDNGIETIGVGSNLQEAKQPFIQELNGIKVGFLNFTENEWTIATNTSAGANPLDLIEVHNTIQNLKKIVDKIVVIAHGGNEFYHLPSPRIKRTYRFFIDAGANAVVSHHTHCFSGYEVYKESPIFYGLGNFMYDWPNKENDNWNFGFAVRLYIDDQIEFEIIPFKQNNGEEIGVHYLNKSEAETFNKRIKELNSIISDDEKLEIEFDKLCKEKTDIYSLYFEPYSGKILSSLRIRKLLPDLFSKRKRMLQLNIVRCESHRDILLKMLEKSVKKK